MIVGLRFRCRTSSRACRASDRRALLAATLLLNVAAAAAAPTATGGWPHYGGTAGGSHYSSLAQIHRGNVRDLKLAWSYRTGELVRRGELGRTGSFQDTPILAAGSLIVAWRSESHWRLNLQLASLCAFCALLAAFCWIPSFWPALAVLFFANVFASVFGTVNSTAIQLSIPDEVRGRVSSFLMMSFSLPLIGVLPISYAAREIGVQLAVSGAALLAIVCSVLFCALSPTLRGMDTAPR